MNDKYALSPSQKITDTILEVSRLTGRSDNATIIINDILRYLSEQMSLEQGRVILPNPETGLLSITYAYGLSNKQQTQGVYALDEGITGRVMSTGKPALISDIRKDSEYISRITARPDHQCNTIAYIAVPIIQNDAPVGVLAAHRFDPQKHQLENDLYLLKIVAGMLAQTLHICKLINENTLRIKKKQAYKKLMQEKQSATQNAYGILGNSPQLLKSISEAHKAADTDATVMLIGESGTGKERFARMSHLASSRRERPFVCINCAAIPPNLLESELFGHIKGSFTGATTSRPGKFEIASGGTLFLDEIGDMSIELQSKLLRVLQEKTVQRIGDNKETPVDVRVITATNKHMEDAVKNGNFRLDLYYRLNVIRIDLPPLRQRDGDVELLALYFLNRANQKHRGNAILSKDALECLENYDWPGNVRQLENIIERLVVMSDNDMITTDEVEQTLRQESQINVRNIISIESNVNEQRINYSPTPLKSDSDRPYIKVQGNERKLIMDTLHEANGNKTLAAKRLGISSRQLYYRLNKLAIQY